MKAAATTTDEQSIREGPARDRDARLRQAALEQLRSSGYPLLSRVYCEVAEGVITLSGVVPTYHLKQVAQEVLLRLESHQGVRNMVEVREPAVSPGPMTASPRGQ